MSLCLVTKCLSIILKIRVQLFLFKLLKSFPVTHVCCSFDVFEVKTSLGAPHTLLFTASVLIFDRHASLRHVTRSEVKGSFK
jgi:hypothetical protein